MKDEIKVLLQKARDSLQAAELLKQGGYLGFAASRAYYTLFYVAEALLLDRGLSFSSHSAVIAAFGKEFAKTGVLDPKFHLPGEGMEREEKLGVEVIIRKVAEVISKKYRPDKIILFGS